MRPINQTRCKRYKWEDKHGYKLLIHRMNGSLQHKCNYIDNRADGISFEYFPNGVIKATGIAKDNRRNGYWRTRYTSSSQERHIEYLIGQKINLEYTDGLKIYHL